MSLFYNRLKTSRDGFLQKRCHRSTIPAKLWRQINNLVKASGAYANEAELVREAIREKL